MSVSVTVAGVSYTIPTVGDVTWGPQVTAWIQAISSSTLQTTGGVFTLTGDLNFGASFGLLSKYFTSLTANAAGSGVFRLANNESVSWRNAANSANLGLKLDSSNIFQLGAPLTVAGNLIATSFASGTFSTPILSVDGLVSAPGVAFASEPSTGLFRLGTTDIAIALGGVQAMEFYKFSSSQINVGFNTAAATNNANVFTAMGSFNGTTLYQYGNLSTGTSSATAFQILNGTPSTAVALNLENHAYTTTGYLAGACLLSAGSGCAPLFFVGNEWASGGNISFGVGGRAAANVQAVLTVGSFTLNNGNTFVMNGSGSGAVTIATQAAAGTWTLTLPTTGGTSGYALTTNGSGTSTWSSVLTNPMTTLGDLIVGGASGAPARLAIGNNGQVPMAQSTATNGVGWTNPNFQNFLVNSAFDYWQAGTSTTLTAAGGGTATNVYAYQADQWYANNILGGGTVEGIITYSRVSGVTNGSLFGAKLLITTAPTGTGIQNGCELYQVLSNGASLSLYGQTASFSVLVKAFGTVNQVGVQFFYATTEAKPAVAIGSEVLTTVNTSTFTACTINGQALGTSQTASGVIGVRIRITAVSSGHTYDLNNGFSCEQAILNLGPVALPYARQYANPAQEIAACEYFYQKSYDLNTAPGTSTAVGIWRGLAQSSTDLYYETVQLRTTMRADPTVSAYGQTGTASVWYDATASANSGNVQINNAGTRAFNWICSNTAMTANHIQSEHWVADARI